MAFADSRRHRRPKRFSTEPLEAAESLSSHQCRESQWKLGRRVLFKLFLFISVCGEQMCLVLFWNHFLLKCSTSCLLKLEENVILNTKVREQQLCFSLQRDGLQLREPRWDRSSEITLADGC